MNKKRITLLLSNLMVASTIFIGCGNSKDANKNTTGIHNKITKTSERSITEFDDVTNEVEEDTAPAVSPQKTSIDGGNLYSETSEISGEENNLNNLDVEGSQEEPQLPSQPVEVATKEIGKVNVLRAYGGLEIIGKDGKDKKPQGTIQVTFRLSSQILDEVVKVSSIRQQNEQLIQVEDKKLSDIILSAYEETVVDANTNYDGAAITPKREELQQALKQLFTGNNIKIVLKDQNGDNINIPYDGAIIAPDKSANICYLRYIVDLDGMLNSRGATLSEVEKPSEIQASDVPISLILRNPNVDGKSNDVIRTGNTYTFVGIDGNGVGSGQLMIEGSQDESGEKRYKISGFKFGACKTARTPAKFEAVDDIGKNIIYKSTKWTSTGGNKDETNMYATKINPHYYVNMKELNVENEKSVLSATNNLRLPGIIFKDPEKTILKIEIKDNEDRKYPCELVDLDVTDKSKGAYLKINGLQENTSYIFEDIFLTSNVIGIEEVDVIPLREHDSSKVNLNTKSIKTSMFIAPKITLGSETANGDIDLPGGLKVPAVKNDSTGLRYILTIEDLENITNGLRVTGLQGNDKAKIEDMSESRGAKKYYSVTLTGLTPEKDYSYLGVEFDYKDNNNNSGTAKTTLGELNSKGSDQFNNVTEKAGLLPTFSVTVSNSVTSEYGRRAYIPVFMDDIGESFTRAEVVNKDGNSNIKVEYEDSKLYVTGLEPNSREVLTLAFYYRDKPKGFSSNGEK